MESPFVAVISRALFCADVRVLKNETHCPCVIWLFIT
jgi:hypothetical protein